MPRRNSATGRATTHAHTTRQKGKNRRGHGLSTYARLQKGRHSEQYDRPYLDGTYDKELEP